MTKTGRFGKYGGQYVPEIVMPALNELEAAYKKYKEDPDFQKEFRFYLQEYAGRPTRLYYAEKLSKYYGKAKIFLKREDLLHTGAHKINNALGQALLAKRMGKKRIVAETGAGQHGVQTGDQRVPVVRVVHHRQHQAEMAAPLPESPQPQEGAGVLVEDVGR